MIAVTFWSDSFLTKGNILNVLRQVASGAGIMAVGMLFVILTRGIDLSVGSIAALGSVLTGYFITFAGFGTATTIICVMLAGAACGLVTGGFIAYLRPRRPSTIAGWLAQRSRAAEASAGVNPRSRAASSNSPSCAALASSKS